ncbi:MAG: hypothetical protein LIO76_09385 [Clostridiales bacterium]|nr:hypothetical protein [Clostridiales bacterium]
MKKNVRNDWIRAVGRDDPEAFYRLGRYYLRRGGVSGGDRTLGRVCLKKAMQLGSEEAFFLYHHLYSRGEKVIDDASYEEMAKAYVSGYPYSSDGKHGESGEDTFPLTQGMSRQTLRRYLELGTKKQKRRAGRIEKETEREQEEINADRNGI